MHGADLSLLVLNSVVELGTPVSFILEKARLFFDCGHELGKLAVERFKASFKLAVL